jgi:very-short-patch-repair endonuclease
MTVERFAETPAGGLTPSLEGKKSRRQYGIGPYIADFYSPECSLVVELDGAARRTARDRTTNLKELGIRVMRFKNRAVFESLELVLLESIDHTTPAFGHPSSC